MKKRPMMRLSRKTREKLHKLRNRDFNYRFFKGTNWNLLRDKDTMACPLTQLYIMEHPEIPNEDVDNSLALMYAEKLGIAWSEAEIIVEAADRADHPYRPYLERILGVK